MTPAMNAFWELRGMSTLMESHSADLVAGTWAFHSVGGFRASAGNFYVIPEIEMNNFRARIDRDEARGDDPANRDANALPATDEKLREAVRKLLEYGGKPVDPATLYSRLYAVAEELGIAP